MKNKSQLVETEELRRHPSKETDIETPQDTTVPTGQKGNSPVPMWALDDPYRLLAAVKIVASMRGDIWQFLVTKNVPSS